MLEILDEVEADDRCGVMVPREKARPSLRAWAIKNIL
jgi:hypothetical protein